MHLSTYLQRQGITQRDFGKRIKLQQPTISRWCSGDATPNPRNIQIIQRATRGRVTMRDWLRHQRA